MKDRRASLSALLAEIRDGKQRVPARRLATLSGLEGPDLALFQATWGALAPERRRDLMARLEELSQDSLELAFDQLFLLGLDDPDKDVRIAAITGLGDGQERTAIRPLLRLLAQDQEEEARAAAAQALSDFALMAELDELRPEQAREVTQGLLATVRNERESLEVRRRALEAVAAVDSAEVKSLIRRAFYEGEELEKTSAIYAMGRNLDPEWFPLLVEELGSGNQEFRCEAAAALGELGLEEAIEPLTQALDDEDTQVQLSAIHALGQIGGDQAKEALQRILGKDDEVLREAAQEELAEMALIEGYSSLLPDDRSN